MLAACAQVDKAETGWTAERKNTAEEVRLINLLKSSDVQAQIKAVDELIALGAPGQEILINNFPDGKFAAKHIIRYWSDINQDVYHRGGFITKPIHMLSTQQHKWWSIIRPFNIRKHHLIDFGFFEAISGFNYFIFPWVFKISQE